MPRVHCAAMTDCLSIRRTTKRPPFVLAKIALQEGLASGECPVCFSSRKATRRYIHSFLYEGMMSSLARQEFLGGGGFCREHFWEAKNIERECWADGFGVAILCENLLEAFAQDLEKLKTTKPRSNMSFRKLRRPARNQEFSFTPGSKCLACEIARSTEQRRLATLEELLTDSNFSERFEESAGLCVGHIHTISEYWTSETAVEIVKRVATKQVRKLVDLLREFQRKHDYRYKNEPKGPEWSSPEKTIGFLVGPKQELGG
jgi:Family of unknown function (DUF6062)